MSEMPGNDSKGQKSTEGSEGAVKEKSQRGLHQEDPERFSDNDESDDDDDLDISEDLLRRMLDLKLNPGGAEKREHPKVLDDVSFQGIVDYIRQGKAKNIITMAGAGISTSAGIPDFRTPGSGLYDNLQKYNLPNPEAIFTLSFFKENPQPFYQLAKELYPGNFIPTPSHLFIRLLEKKGLLLRHYTQNIDTLERVAGVSAEKLVEAHGTFHTAHCIECRKEYTQEYVKEKIFADVVPRCEACEKLIKPDIVFFGESLPQRFFQLVQQDFQQCDLLIIMGTSLTVQPFASLVSKVRDTCPRLLLNLTKVGSTGNDFVLRLLGMGGMDYDSEDAYRDVARLGPCDEGCLELVRQLGWKDDFDALSKSQEEDESKR